MAKISLPSLLGTLYLHSQIQIIKKLLAAAGSYHTLKNAQQVRKTNMCKTKSILKTLLKNEIILFAPQCKCRSKLCKEAKEIKGFRPHICLMALLTPLDIFESCAVNLAATPLSVKYINQQRALIWAKISSSIPICYWFMKPGFNLSQRASIFSFR